MEGNSGVPYIGEKNAVGKHYGKLGGDMTGVVRLTEDLPVSIKLTPRGPRSSMIADQIRKTARPAMSTVKNLKMEQRPAENIEV